MVPETVEAPIVTPARVIGRICADGHARIIHYEKGCPLCACADLLIRAKERVDEVNERIERLEQVAAFVERVRELQGE